MTRTRLFVALGLAAVLALGFFGYRTYTLQYGNEQLAAHYYKVRAPALPAVDTSAYAEGMRWLLEDGYSQATAAFNRVARTDPDYPSAQYFAGQAYYRNGQLNAARSALLNATDIGPSTIAPHAEWLLLLTYLKDGRTEREFFQLLDRLVIDTQHPFHARAKALREDFESPWRQRWETLTYGKRGTY